MILRNSYIKMINCSCDYTLFQINGSHTCFHLEFLGIQNVVHWNINEPKKNFCQKIKLKKFRSIIQFP